MPPDASLHPEETRMPYINLAVGSPVKWEVPAGKLGRSSPALLPLGAGGWASRHKHCYRIGRTFLEVRLLKQMRGILWPRQKRMSYPLFSNVSWSWDFSGPSIGIARGEIAFALLCCHGLCASFSALIPHFEPHTCFGCASSSV